MNAADESGSSQNEDKNGKTSHARNLSPLESSRLVEAVQIWGNGVDARQRGFFLARKDCEANLSASSPESSKFSWKIASLSSYENGFFKDAAFENCYVCFADPSNYDSAPGWMLRNLLVLVKQRWGLDNVQVLRHRDSHSKPDQGRSIVITLESKHPHTSKTIESQQFHSPMPKVTGWERNHVGKLAGKVVDLTEYLDPKRYSGIKSVNSTLQIAYFSATRLADQSVDLNLKLMKWRISPNLNLEKVKRTRCLLLGAGTLGSYVARNLMVWIHRKNECI